MEDAQAAANVTVRAFLTELSNCMFAAFPHHAQALRGEIVGTKLTEDRWRRIAAVLASMHCVPGTALSPREHGVRNLVLHAVTVASCMAKAAFGGQEPERWRGLAVGIAADIGGRMT